MTVLKETVVGILRSRISIFFFSIKETSGDVTISLLECPSREENNDWNLPTPESGHQNPYLVGERGT